MSIFLPEFCDFGGDHELAVALVGITREVLLMIIFSREEGVEGCEFGDDGGGEEFLGGELFDDFFGFGFLLINCVENGRPVLCTDIRALAVEGGRVVNGKEDVQKVSEGDDGGVVDDSDHLGMACGAAANLFVGGVWTFAASIARNNVYHAPHLVKYGFEAPEASAGEHSLVEWLSIHKDNYSLISQVNRERRIENQNKIHSR